MTATTRLFVLASYMRDVSVGVDRFPLPGETRVGGDGLESHGGKGSNQAIQAARCGASVAILAAVGDDAAGRSAIAFWYAERINATCVVTRTGSATGLAVIVVDATGQNQIVIAPGANSTLQSSDIDSARHLIASADVVIAQLETPLAVTVRAFELARAAGVQTLLNTAPAPQSLPDRLWALTDILVANELEGATLAGAEPDVDPLAIGQALLPRVGVAVVITLGAQGAVLFQKHADTLRCAALPVSVVDSTGAGDAFVGAFGAHWAGTRDPRQALAMGVAAGSLACTRRGVAPALADGAAIEHAMRLHTPGFSAGTVAPAAAPTNP